MSAYWYSAGKQYTFGREPDVLHANVNTGKEFGLGEPTFGCVAALDPG